MEFTDKSELNELAQTHQNWAGSVRTFIRTVEGATWTKPTDVNGIPQGTFKNADPVTLTDGRKAIVFDVANNNLRVVAIIDYGDKLVTVLMAGTHREYDRYQRQNILSE